MNQLNWYKAVGFGALIWLIMFATVSALVGFGISMTTGWSVALAVFMGILSYVFAINANAQTSGQAWGYAATWVAVAIVLDLIVSARFQSGLFGMWTYWLGAALVLVAPWVEYSIQGAGAHQKAV